MLVVLLVFVTTSLAVAATGLALYDWRVRQQPIAAPGEDDPRRPASPWGDHWIDRWLWRLLQQAGTPISPAALVALAGGLAVVGCAVPLALVDSVWGAAAGATLGPVLPLVALGVLRQRRLGQMRKQLPEALDVLADAVRAGRNLEQASEEVARQELEPLSLEFADAAAQLRLGQVPQRVLERLVERVPLTEMRVLAAAAGVHRQSGGNLGLLVERLSLASRERLGFYGHLQSVTAGSRLSAMGLVLATIVAVALLSYMQPEYLQMFFEHPWGPSLLATAAGLQLLGIVWVTRLLRIEF